MRSRILFLLVIVLFGTGAQMLAQTQSEMNEEACKKVKKAHAELDRLHQRILTANAKDTNFVKALRDAQRVWIAFRDAHLRSNFPDPDWETYGSVYPMCRCNVPSEDYD